MLVLDANILIRAILGHRVRELIESYAPKGIRFFTPGVAFEDARTYLHYFSKKRNKPQADLTSSLEYLRGVVEPLTPELGGAVEIEARQRLRGREESDWPVLDSAHALVCAKWT